MVVVEAKLPREVSVLMPTEITSEWFEHGRTGYLKPEWLAPYADQPRTYMDPTGLEELEASVKATGVREPIVITPVRYAPWATFEPGDEDLQFLIVSGHRRRTAAVEAQLEAVPVEVRVYATEEDFNDDADILNDHRQDLSEIEVGWQLRRKVDGGEKLTHIRDRTGRAYQWLQGRIHLTYLSPDIQQLISPRLKRRQRLAIGFASALGSLQVDSEDFDLSEKLSELGDLEPVPEDLSEEDQRFRLQHAYLRYCQKQKWRGVDSEQFVRTGKRPGHRSGRSHTKGLTSEEKKKPLGTREWLIDWLVELQESGFLDKTNNEHIMIFSNAVRQDLDEVVGLLEMVTDVIRTVAEKKKYFSDTALGNTERPEQKIFEAA